MIESISLRSTDISLYKWYVIQIICIFVTLASIFAANHGLLPFTNQYITDSTFYESHALGDSASIGLPTFIRLNSWMYKIGPQSFTIYNSILLFASIYFCKQFSIISDKAVTLARTSIVFNPYFLISVTGPTKEINLTFLSLLAFYLFCHRSWMFKLLSLAVIAYAITVRSQFGLILFAGFLVGGPLRFFKNPINICLYILGLYFILNSFSFTREIIVENAGGEELTSFNMSAYYQIALILLEMNNNPALQFVVFAVKVVLGLFTQVVRPNSTFSGNVPLLDIGYTYLGIFIFPLNLSFLVLFFKRLKLSIKPLDIRISMIIVYTFIGMLSTIISPIVQFRYLFPYLPFLAACLYLHPIKIRNRILLFSMLICALSFIGTSLFFSREFGLESSNSLPVFILWL